jgi:indolepyruvate ferredoxin oxidoreductase alpha subunit
VLNRLKLVVAGDIGCYTLGATPPLSAMDSCICMGASIGGALGLEKARGREFARKLVAVIGDSTFLHSGITGLLDVVYNQGTFTTIILDNSTTAMTGHQDHPGTGRRADGKATPAVDLVRLVRSLGIKRVQVVDPYDLAELERVLKEEAEAEEASVVIARRPCVLLKGHRLTGGPVTVWEEKCTGCGRCRRLGCPALVFKGGDKPVVDPSQCNGCGKCVQVCRFTAIGKAGEKLE